MNQKFSFLLSTMKNKMDFISAMGMDKKTTAAIKKDSALLDERDFKLIVLKASDSAEQSKVIFQNIYWNKLADVLVDTVETDTVREIVALSEGQLSSKYSGDPVATIDSLAGILAFLFESGTLLATDYWLHLEEELKDSEAALNFMDSPCVEISVEFFLEILKEKV